MCKNAFLYSQFAGTDSSCVCLLQCLSKLPTERFQGKPIPPKKREGLRKPQAEACTTRLKSVLIIIEVIYFFDGHQYFSSISPSILLKCPEQIQVNKPPLYFFRSSLSLAYEGNIGNISIGIPKLFLILLSSHILKVVAEQF